MNDSIDNDQITFKHFLLVFDLFTHADIVWPRNIAVSLYFLKIQNNWTKKNAEKKGSKERFMTSCCIVWVWLNDTFWNICTIANIQLYKTLASNYAGNEFCIRHCATPSVLLMMMKKLTKVNMKQQWNGSYWQRGDK